MVGGFDGGLCALNADQRAERRWRAPSPLPSDLSADGLPDPRAHALLIDGQALWVGTEGGLGYVPDRESMLAAVDET